MGRSEVSTLRPRGEQWCDPRLPWRTTCRSRLPTPCWTTPCWTDGGQEEGVPCGPEGTWVTWGVTQLLPTPTVASWFLTFHPHGHCGVATS